MPVAHQPLTAVIGEFVGMAVEQGGNLRLDRLGQQRSRAIAQHISQRIGECPAFLLPGGPQSSLDLDRD
jgi:hypothetical protein